MRKAWKSAAMVAAAHTGENPLFALDYALRFVRVAVLLAVWRAVLSVHAPVGGLTLPRVLTYTLLAAVTADLRDGGTQLESDLWEGTIATRFLRPMPIFSQYAAEAAGSWAFGLLAFGLPVVALAPVLGVSVRPASVGAGAAFALSLALAIAVGLALDLAFGALMVAMEQNWWAMQLVRRSIVGVASGALIPLAAYPRPVGRVLGLLPFAATASSPLRIFVGTGRPLPLLLGQVAWCAVLWPVAAWAWRSNRQRLVTSGG